MTNYRTLFDRSNTCISIVIFHNTLIEWYNWIWLSVHRAEIYRYIHTYMNTSYDYLFQFFSVCVTKGSGFTGQEPSWIPVILSLAWQESRDFLNPFELSIHMHIYIYIYIDSCMHRSGRAVLHTKSTDSCINAHDGRNIVGCAFALQGASAWNTSVMSTRTIALVALWLGRSRCQDRIASRRRVLPLS